MYRRLMCVHVLHALIIGDCNVSDSAVFGERLRAVVDLLYCDFTTSVSTTLKGVPS